MERVSLRIGIDVGGTNTDAVLMQGGTVLAWTKRATTADVSSGVAAAIADVLAQGGTPPEAITSVMIGTTHLANALVERSRLDPVGVLRLASPSGEALPPLTGWPQALVDQVGQHIFLLPGGYEVDGRDISPFDEGKVRQAARELRRRGVNAIAITSAFASINATMELRAAEAVRAEHPDAVVSLSHTIGRIGLIERENAVILNAALTSLAKSVFTSFEAALKDMGIAAELYISQNDGTLISAAQAILYPVLTIGSGPTNSMRGAAFLTGVQDAIVMDVGGTTTDIGVLVNGFPRESSLAIDIGGVRTNFRMPDILAIGLGGGTRVRDDADGLRVGPDSVGFRITSEALLFGGSTLTTSDVAAALGRADFGDPAGLAHLSPQLLDAAWAQIQGLLEDGVDRMKTTPGDATILAVGGGSCLIPDTLRGAARVLRPRHAGVANAVGAAIAQVGAQVEQIVSYDSVPRAQAIQAAQAEARDRVVAAGGAAASVQIVDIEEIYLSYIPGNTAQLKVRAVGDLAATADTAAKGGGRAHAHQFD